MPSGNPGVPKTKAQRAKIAASVAAYHAQAKAAIGRIDTVDTVDESVRVMTDFMQQALLALGDASLLVKGRVAELQDRVDDLEEQLSERGKAIEQMSVKDLSVAEHAGLVSKATVEAEFRRRAAAVNSPRPLQHSAGGGFVVGGWLP